MNEVTRAPRHESPDDETATRRGICTQFRFWQSCGVKACRRARQCRGEPHACYRRGWAAFSEAERDYIRFIITARLQGKTMPEAAAAARAAKVGVAALVGADAPLPTRGGRRHGRRLTTRRAG